MYGLPPDIDLSFFAGQKLIQVCVGFHDLILHFDEGVSATITSAVGCRNRHEMSCRFEEFPVAASAVAGFLNKVVKCARGDTDGTLTIEFEGDEWLEMYDDSEQFESYVIKHGDREIVV